MNNQASLLLAEDYPFMKALDQKTFLITGGSGMLGKAFQKQITKLVPGACVYAPNRQALDIRHPEHFAPYAKLKPDYVVHCAAMVDADKCEEQHEEAHKSIVTGTANVVQFSNNCGARLLYPQSFLIYNDAAGLIDENTPAHPMNIYGKLKLEAEGIVIDSAKFPLSVRMGGFFGGEEIDNNFVGKITSHLSKLISSGTTSIDIGNRVWQPTYTEDLATNCLLLLAHEKQGIYCMSSHGEASFHQLTVAIANILGIADQIEIRCINASIVQAREPARRPFSAIMENRRLQTENLDRQRAWQQALTVYLNQPFFGKLFHE